MSIERTPEDVTRFSADMKRIATVPHTPGPWTLDDDTDTPVDGIPQSTFDIWIGTKPAGNTIARIGDDPTLTYQQHLANARLIAAAPELYDLVRGWMADSHVATFAQACEIARALLARIDGTEPQP